MNAVIVEISGKEMVVMDSKGCFHRMKTKDNYNIGDEILFRPNKSFISSYFKPIAAIAATIILMISGAGYGYREYYSPYAYVDIDINPSIELVLNKHMKVLNVENLNDDAGKIIKDVKGFKNKSVEQAVEMVLDNVESQQILKDDQENVLMYTVSGVNEQQLPELNKKIENVTIKRLSKRLKKENIIMEQVSIEKRNEASKLKLSPGRVILFEKLKKVKPDAKLEEVEKMPVRETIKLIKEYKNKNRESTQPIQKVKNNDSNNNKTGKKPEVERFKKDKKNFKNNNASMTNIINDLKSKKRLVRDVKNNEVSNKEVKNKVRTKVLKDNIKKRVQKSYNKAKVIREKIRDLKQKDNKNIEAKVKIKEELRDKREKQKVVKDGIVKIKERKNKKNWDYPKNKFKLTKIYKKRKGRTKVWKKI